MLSNMRVARQAVQRSAQGLRSARWRGMATGWGIDKPVYQVFGANTDVGKTIVSAALCRAAVQSVEPGAAESPAVMYLKPVQTGPPAEDEGFVRQMCGVGLRDSNGSVDQILRGDTLFQWENPVSPHVAVDLEGHTVSDETIVSSVRASVADAGATRLTLVETAGGVCSPAPSGRPQVDVLRPLRLPAVLVGDPKLGGISATLSALDSLQLRGYDVTAVVFLDDAGGPEAHTNAHAVRAHIASSAPLLEAPPAVFSLPALPPMPEPLTQWVQTPKCEGVVNEVLHHLESAHKARTARYTRVQEEGRESIWWPFTQHKAQQAPMLIDSAHGNDFTVLNGGSSSSSSSSSSASSSSSSSPMLAPLFDSCGSWWTNTVGHGEVNMARAAAYAAGRYGHVIFPENTHEPAVQLSKLLLDGPGKGWANKVFFSDNGSTAIEVAQKMAFRKYTTDHNLPHDTSALCCVALHNSYHGDTLGCMDVQPPNVFTEGQHPWYEPKALFFESPSLHLKNGEWRVSLPEAVQRFAKENAHEFGAYADLSADMTFPTRDAAYSIAGRQGAQLSKLYAAFVDNTLAAQPQPGDDLKPGQALPGALLMETLFLGAGGMVALDPLFQRALVNGCRARKIPVIYDEVFAGLWRLGAQSAQDVLEVQPDISCYAKILTGGTVPLSVTVASQDVFDVFLGDTKAEALLHGHSYTAHAMGCTAGVSALRMLTDPAHNPNYVPSNDDSGGGGRMRELWPTQRLNELSFREDVSGITCLGTVMAVTLSGGEGGYASSRAAPVVKALRAQGIYSRPLGNVVYLMVTPVTQPEECERLVGVLEEAMDSALAAQ